MSSSSDEFDLYDFSEFSSADLSLIDAVASTPASTTDRTNASRKSTGDRATSSRSGGPRIAVEFEPSTDSRIVKAAEPSASGTRVGGDDKGKGTTAGPDRRSPFERYRWRKTLSVSDLVGPTWCEVQFDYGLRQGRSRKLADRPASFVSATGKTITVEKQVAASNDKILKRGQSVHKALEREIRPDERLVDVTTDEERWALRLLNMIQCLESLVELGLCREMPVFGTVQGEQIVTGIIDEITRKPIPPEATEPTSPSKKRPPSSSPGTPSKSKKRRTPSPQKSQPQLTTYFSSPSEASTKKPPRSPPTHILYISDTKTRRSSSVPSDDDALSSRLQLMLYNRLLTSLLSPDFPFESIWLRLKLDAFRPLSDSFLVESGLISDDPEAILGYPSCLDDLVDMWHNTIDALHVAGVSPTLEIVYRTQPRQSAKADARPPSASVEMAAAAQEARDIARAIEASLRDPDYDLERAIEESMKHTGAEAEPVAAGQVVEELTPPRTAEAQLADPQVAWLAQEGALERVQPSLLATIIENGRLENEGETATDFLAQTTTPAAEPTAPPAEGTDSKILGRKRFQLDDRILDEHLQNVLLWWHGARPPQGVDIEHSRRCFTCEYQYDCEWRENKAREVVAKLNGRHDTLLSIE
ncbi:hypothetical protein BV25DRAFT_1993601 [Artomyces pyxidatus]|uniref:Uncharacterized protein n=1 Tax=Artomyces pyxidatus TaxID=48021 RepID=A0ACB8STG5_9AGAM|nr:hypothetical protein BV25DRAFT_1993601 [Artomyces pyxidatus]